MIQDIENHFKKEFPKEGCGIIGITKGKKEWFPCKNIAERDIDFIICPEDYFKIKQKTNIFAIVHNHIDQSNEPSDCDINNCNALGLPYYIFSFPDMELNIVEPTKRTFPLIGREYEFGVTDCYEAAKDYYKSIDIQVPSREVYQERWWEEDQFNYMTEESILEKGFKKVQEPRKNDLIVFSIRSSINNHIGVFLENDIFFHHAEHRLSCKESLYPHWAKYVTGFYRYDA
jgi:proteasome lid subunit RPN8/RPN11